MSDMIDAMRFAVENAFAANEAGKKLNKKRPVFDYNPNNNHFTKGSWFQDALNSHAKVVPDWSEHKVKFFRDELKKANLYEKFVKVFEAETIEFEMIEPVKPEIVKYGFFKL